MHRHAVATRDVASKVVVGADAIRVCRLDTLAKILAQEVAAVVRAPEPFQGAVLEDDRLELGNQGHAGSPLAPTFQR